MFSNSSERSTASCDPGCEQCSKLRSKSTFRFRLILGADCWCQSITAATVAAPKSFHSTSVRTCFTVSCAPTWSSNEYQNVSGFWKMDWSLSLKRSFTSSSSQSSISVGEGNAPHIPRIFTVRLMLRAEVWKIAFSVSDPVFQLKCFSYNITNKRTWTKQTRNLKLKHHKQLSTNWNMNSKCARTRARQEPSCYKEPESRQPAPTDKTPDQAPTRSQHRGGNDDAKPARARGGKGGHPRKPPSPSQAPPPQPGTRWDRTVSLVNQGIMFVLTRA